ncbi:MAG: tetratricopeptide repeat protein [Bacteroidia bacterium]|jgi:tetratricopeptide (TPR) repeat protein|nr:tetratricopeptide repeat protein [Bacteroidia bacterium]GIV23978.1 MAG: hypothetical protein KatS3mg025_1637 [Bacteroidia bacterium]
MAKVSVWLLGLVGLLLFAQKKPQSPKKDKDHTASADTHVWRQAVPPFVRGVVLWSQGLSEEAAEFFYKAAEAAPHSPGIHYYLARLAYTQEDYIRMLTHAEKAYREAPNELWIGIGYAIALELNGQKKQAVEILERLHKLYPQEPEILLRLAQAYQQIGQIDKADAYYNKLLAVEGSYEEVFQARVRLFVEAGHLGRAIALAESTVALWPKHEGYWETLTRLYELSRNLPRMAEVVQKLLEIDPANMVGWSLVLAYPEYFEQLWGPEMWEELLAAPAVPAEVKYSLLQRADFLEEEDYQQVLAQLLRQQPSAVGWDLWGRFWAGKGHWDSAAVAWKRAWSADTQGLSFLASYLYALYRLGGGDSLLREVEKTQELFPGQGRFFLWEGVAAAQCRQWTRASAAFTRGWRLFVGGDSVLAQAAAYYHLLTELAQGGLSASTRERFLRECGTSVGEALIALLQARQGQKASQLQTAAPALPEPYRRWAAFWMAYAEGRLDEARRIAASAAEETSLPLEMWEDFLLRLTPQTVGTLYQRWRQKAAQAYPLACFWRDLP